MSELVFETFGPEDFPRLMEWVDSPELLLIWGGPAFHFPLDEGQLRSYLEPALEEPPARIIYRVLEAGSPQVVGHIELNSIDRQHGLASVSRVMVAPGRRGQGTGLKMISKLQEIAFNHVGLHRLELHVFDFNHAAISCYTKAGFVKEGVLRHHRRIKGEYWNNVLMSILEDEWRSRGVPGL